MYLIRKNFNIAQNDMISTYGLSMTQLGMIGLGFSITYGVGKTLVSYYADGKNTKQFLPFMLILSAICMLGFSASMGEMCIRDSLGSTSSDPPAGSRSPTATSGSGNACWGGRQTTPRRTPPGSAE